MATYAAPAPQVVAHRVEREERGFMSWLTTTDHKRIGIMYMVLTFVFFILGGVEALMIRLQLGAPENTLVAPQTYNQLFTMHGTTMIFLFVVPMMAGLANYFLPLMIGARDMAFPRLNALSFWLLLAGGIVFYASIFWNPPEAGWTSYPPLSNAFFSPGGGQDAWIYLIHLTGLSSLVGAINFYVTVANMRAPGMSWGRLPLFIWTILTYSVLLIFALPVIAAAVTMLLTDRHFGTHFFDASQGGSPLLWQDLFWFFGHPEVYIMVLPAFGVVSEILPVFARKPIFGYKAIAASTVSIGFLGFLVWAHHMFATPLPEAIIVFAMLSSMLIAIPTGVKIFNWIGTLWRGTIEYKTPLLFCVGFIALFIIGGISGVFLAIFPVDWQLNETYFVVAHIHFVLVGGAVMPIFAAIYYWFPKITGRMLNEGLGKLSFWLMFWGILVTFMIQHAIGLEGMPRRVYEYENVGHLALYNLISTVGSFILAAGVLVTVAQRPAQPQAGRDRRARPVESEHARVVHDLAPGRQQLRRGPARALGRTDEGHSPGDRAPHLRRAGARPCDRARRGHAGGRVAPCALGWLRLRCDGGLVRTAYRRSPALAATRLGPGDRARLQQLRDYLELTKPKVQSLLLLTTITTMYVAGDPSVLLVALTCLGGYLSAGGAGAVNHWYDRDIDARMARTATRPIPAGRIAPTAALTFGLRLAALSFLELSLTVNVLAASLALAGFLGYVLVYTVWLKRRTPQNIVIGGAAGAVPPLVGWAAVTGSISATAVLLFFIVFFWTPPHFWALSLLMKGEYEKVGVPMLPVVRGEAETRRQILLYAVLLYAVTQLPFCAGGFGGIYLAASLVLGLGFIGGAVRLYRRADRRSALQLYLYSLAYLALLFSAMVLDARLSL